MKANDDYILKDAFNNQKDKFLNQLFNRSIFAMAILDTNEIIIDVNLQFLKLFKYDKEELIGGFINDFVIPKGYEDSADLFLQRALNKESFDDKSTRRDKFGTLIDVEVECSPIMMDDKVIGMFAMYKDIRSELSAIREPDKQKSYFKQLFENSPEAIAMLDEDDKVISINKSFEQLFEYDKIEVLDKNINTLIVSERYLEEAYKFSQYVFSGGEYLRVETIRKSKFGKLIEVEILVYPIYLYDERVGAYAIYSDIRDRKSKEREINKLLYTDTLTELFNRKYVYENIPIKIEKAKINGMNLYFFYFDLNDFKSVNDTLGHIVGDGLLKSISTRLKDKFESQIEFSRIGGDEFLGIASNTYSKSIDQYMTEIHSVFDKEFNILGEVIKSSASIGFSVYPVDGKDIDSLIAIADTRMYDEKRKKKSQYL